MILPAKTQSPFDWEKVAFFPLPKEVPWLQSHLQNPFPEHLEGSRYKIHIAGRDESNQARGGWIEIDLNDLSQPCSYSATPTLDLGALGCFDDCGVMPGSIVTQDGTQYMYYTGWSRAGKTPFTFYIGLATSTDNGESFQRVSQAPVLGRTHTDPLMNAAPWVVVEENIWKMWYVSATKWVQEAESLKHYYHIRYAESENGIDWNTDGTICIDFAGDEYAIARPVVTRLGNTYTMWYCYRGGDRTYSTGYAESADGKSWQRRDQLAGLTPSDSGWDSEMICYPCPLSYSGSQYLLYNGNEYGKDGFGVARLKA